MIESVLQTDLSLALFVVAGLATTTLAIVRDTRGQRVAMPPEAPTGSRRERRSPRPQR